MSAVLYCSSNTFAAAFHICRSSLFAPSQRVMWSWQHGTNKWLWNTKGHSAARGSGCRLLTAETAIRSLGRPCEICSGYSDTGTGLLWVLLPPPRAAISTMIQVNSWFNKMINGTNDFAVPEGSTFHEKNKRKYCNVHCTCARDVRSDHTNVSSCKGYVLHLEVQTCL